MIGDANDGRSKGRDRSSGPGDRGQAYTLEGFISAIVVLTALLFALQSVVITPTTGGSVDRSVQAQLQQEATDSLVVAESDGQLSRALRNWNYESGGGGEYNWSDRTDAQAGYYSFERFSNESAFGVLLEKRFKDSGRSYNVEAVYRNGSDDRESFYLVYQGAPTSNAFVASHTVTLTDDQRLTAPGSEEHTVSEASENDDYPIPDADRNSALYNVVELRVIVW